MSKYDKSSQGSTFSVNVNENTPPLTPTPPPTTDIKQILLTLEKEYAERVGDALRGGDITAIEFAPPFKRAEEALNQLIQQATDEAVQAALLKLKKDMQMHTVPEGFDLITRSYLNNSIDFMVSQLNTNKGSDEK